VASSPKQPSPKQRWRESFADPGCDAFAAIVSADVELDGSALARPVHDLGSAEPDHVLFPTLIHVALGLHERHARRSPAKTALVPGLADLPREPARPGEPLTRARPVCSAT
jgi:hypothetical protein